MLSILFLIFFQINLFSQENNSQEINQSTSSTSYYLETEKILKDIEKAIVENKPDENKTILINSVLKDASYKISSIINNYEIKNDTFTYKQALTIIRQAIQSYFQKNNRYPKSLEELIPNYLISIPAINIHSDYKSEIKYIRNTAFDKNYLSAIDNTTEYVYFSDPQSIYCGLLLLNSNKKSEEGEPYYSY